MDKAAVNQLETIRNTHCRSNLNKPFIHSRTRMKGYYGMGINKRIRVFF